VASDEFLIPPPNTMSVDHEHRPVLYLPDGRVLVRAAGFRGDTAMKSGKGGSEKFPKSGGGKKY
jgi:hypothetical protein